MIEVAKTVGLVIAAGAAAFIATWPLVHLIAPPRKEDV